MVEMARNENKVDGEWDGMEQIIKICYECKCRTRATTETERMMILLKYECN